MNKTKTLIGADYYHKFFTDTYEIIRGKEGQPVAQNSYLGCVLSGNISTFDSKNPSFVISMQISISSVLILSTEFEDEVFENRSLGISEHHTKIFSNKNDNFIDNQEVFTEFKVGLSPSKIICVICCIESPIKMMKNSFTFILKALFVLMIFKFLS